MTDTRAFTAAEILQILNDAKGCAERRAALNIIGPEEVKGWTLALVNVAKRLGGEVEMAYVNGLSPFQEYFIKYHRHSGSADYSKADSAEAFSSSVVVFAKDCEDAVNKFPYPRELYTIDEVYPRVNNTLPVTAGE